MHRNPPPRRAAAADTMIVGRYYQPKTLQLDDDTLGTVFFRGPQTEMEGIFFVKFPLAMLG